MSFQSYFGPTRIITIFIIVIVSSSLLLAIDAQQTAKRSKAKKQKLQCNETDFEHNFDRLLVVTSDDRNFPEDQQQLKKFCVESNELFARLNQYKNQCLQETLRNFVSIIVYSTKASMKRICTRKNSPQVTALIDASSCINRNKQLIGKCMNKASANYASIKFVDNAMKMPHICCQFVEIIQCFTDVMNKNGCQDKLPVLLENITNVVGNFLDSTCGEYNLDSDKCEKLPPLKKVKPLSKNFVTNLVEVFNSV